MQLARPTSGVNMFEVLSKPECCVSEEMDCGACLRTAAHNVARVCGGMNQGGLRGIFGHLFAHPFCKSKVHLFERAYAQPLVFLPASK
jgi:hypothetical protein